MGKLIRLFEPEVVNASVVTTVDRAFLFAPNHEPAQPLLARGCPPEALDPASPIVPVPSIINFPIERVRVIRGVIRGGVRAGRPRSGEDLAAGREAR